MNILKTRNNVITYTVNKAINGNMYISIQNGEVVINAPWYMASSQIQKVVEEKRQWIITKINEYEQSCENKKEYAKTKQVKLLGEQYTLKVNYKNCKQPSLDINNKEIKVILPNLYKKIDNKEILNILIEKMYLMVAKKEIEKVMEKTRIMLNIAPEDYEIVKKKSILAECIDGKININPEIMMYNREIIEYVVLHEFCHLKYKKHTKSFYNMLETYMPNYEKYANQINNYKY